MRRASVAEVETQGTRQAPVFSFGRRLSLSSLGSGKYGRGGDRDGVIVRHVPIVIEGGAGESEEEEVKVSVSSVTDDDSSLSSLCSDNSVETSSVGYQSWDDWRKRGRRNGVVEDDVLRIPLKDIKQVRQSPAVKKKSETIRPALTSSPWYILKAETIGVEGCPLHKEQEGAKGNKLGKDKKQSSTISQPLRAPSLIQGGNGSLTPSNRLTVVPVGRSKHNTIPSRTQFERGPGQLSFRETRYTAASDTQKDGRETMEKSRKSDLPFQRQWSFRRQSISPNKKSSDLPASFHAPTLASLSRSLGEPIPQYFRGPSNASEEKQESSMIKYSSQCDLNRTSSSSMTAFKSRMTPSSSTSSIPPKISQENSPSVGILKTPGKRKVSSNNRVEFLNNIMEREIPGRHT